MTTRKTATDKPDLAGEIRAAGIRIADVEQQLRKLAARVENLAAKIEASGR